MPGQPVRGRVRARDILAHPVISAMLEQGEERHLHPAVSNMIVRDGVDVRRYLDTLPPLTLSHDGGAIAGGSLPRHTASALTRRLGVTVDLHPGVVFVSCVDPSHCRLVVLGQKWPDAVMRAMAGRHVSEVIAHPWLDVPGLTITSMEHNASDNGTIVNLARVPWRHAIARRRGWRDGVLEAIDRLLDRIGPTGLAIIDHPLRRRFR